MSRDIDALRGQLVRILDWEEAHVGFDKALAGIPPAKRGVRPAGFEHSVWDLLEHMRIAQQDLLGFCQDASYEHRLAWPGDYWPKTSKPDAAAWNGSLAAFRRDRRAMKRLARDTKDLFSPVPTGKRSQTYLRAILLLADHNGYHLGQVVAIRRALGIWGS